ncbi:sugar ABC transporter substrate-binding protein [Rhodococcus sp. NPDC057014]|uniref:sugar ABC transporter substrate-binding protein n=1 Tax=Rhodococcus sp. NPDC057014 TaxID=3346000 RepID=UPI0036376A5B
MPSSSNNYLAEWQRGFKNEAGELGYSVKIVENNFDQSEQDVQVQQALATAKLPDLFIFWPADAKSGFASLRQLYKSGVPTVVANQPPVGEAQQFMTFYAGVNDYLNGETSGELMMKAREQLERVRPLSSPAGNVLEVKFEAGYQASDARSQGFRDASAAEPFDIVASEYAGFDNETGYKTTSQLIAANKAKGIDFVYAHNDALATGAIRALEEAGYTPGKDVMVVGGNCTGDLTGVAQGKQFGTGLQAAKLEGLYVADVVNRYLTTGAQVTDGEVDAPAQPDTPTQQAQVSRFNYIPNPPVTFSDDQAANATTLDDTHLWGYNMRELCTY